MKQSKRDTALCEKDALQDMLDCEKLLMGYYAASLLEGSCKPLRKEVLKNYTSQAETQFSVFEQMLSRGYYEVQPVQKPMLDGQTEKFSKVQKQLKAE